MASTERPNARPVLGVVRARQGRTGAHVLWVLVFGVLLTVLAFAAAYLWNLPSFHSANVNNPAASSTSGPAAKNWQAPEPAPINPQPYQNATPPEQNHTAP
jgi:hypothetical protein